MMRQKQSRVSPSLTSRSLREQPFLACLVMPFLGCCCPGPWGSTAGCPLGHRLPRVRQCSQDRAGMVLVAVWDCNADSAVHCRAQTPNTTGCVKQGSAQAAVPGESLTLGASPPSTAGREAEGRGDPCHCCSPATKQRGDREGECCFILAWELCSLQPHWQLSLLLKCLQMIPV